MSAPGAASQVLPDLGRGWSRVGPGTARSPHPGGVSSLRGRSPATIFSRLGLQSPGPARTEISHDLLPPTVRIWELQGRAPQASEAALGRG